MSDQDWRRMRKFVAWGVFGLLVLIGISIIVSLFFGPRISGIFYPFFPFHFGWLGGVFMIFVLFLIARWIFLPWRNGNLSCLSSQNHNSVGGAQDILKERYAKGEITKEQFEQMMVDLKSTN